MAELTAPVPAAAHGRRGVPGLVRAAMLLTFAELIVLGSGRILQVGPLTLRMWLYGAGLVWAVISVLQRRRVDAELGTLVLAFAATTLLGALLGLVAGAPLAQVSEDVKPLVFFLSLLFFHATIVDPADVRRVATVIRWGSLVLAVGYFATLLLIASGRIPFATLYQVMSESGEFFFRGQEGFFYKGFLYLGIGFFFFVFRKGVRPKLAAAVLFVAIVLTLTRGLLLTTVVILVLALLLRQRNAVVSLLAVAGVAAVAAALLPLFAAALTDRADSDAMRLADVRAVLEGTTWYSVVLGHGLGTSIGARARIEASYLEILFKQGVAGLLLWFAIALLLARDYWRAVRARRGALAEPFFLGAMYVFVQSATNPFLTNPIGMSMVVVSLVALRVLGSAPVPAGAPEG